jgi:hypothetical protein
VRPAVHKEEPKNIYIYIYSPNIIQVIKSRRIRWARHVVRTVERRSAYRVLVGKPEGRRPF